MHVEAYELLEEILEWLEYGSVDGVFYDDESMAARIREVLGG